MNRRTAKELEESHKKIFNAADKFIIERFAKIEDHIMDSIIKLIKELMRRMEGKSDIKYIEKTAGLPYNDLQKSINNWIESEGGQEKWIQNRADEAVSRLDKIIQKALDKEK